MKHRHRSNSINDQDTEQLPVSESADTGPSLVSEFNPRVLEALLLSILQGHDGEDQKGEALRQTFQEMFELLISLPRRPLDGLIADWTNSFRKGRRNKELKAALLQDVDLRKYSTHDVLLNHALAHAFICGLVAGKMYDGAQAYADSGTPPLG